MSSSKRNIVFIRVLGYEREMRVKISGDTYLMSVIIAFSNFAMIDMSVHAFRVRRTQVHIMACDTADSLHLRSGDVIEVIIPN